MSASTGRVYPRAITNGHDMHGWGSAGTAFMALITGAVLALVWVVVRRVAEPSERVSTAREQLDARLARGENRIEE